MANVILECESRSDGSTPAVVSQLRSSKMDGAYIDTRTADRYAALARVYACFGRDAALALARRSRDAAFKKRLRIF